MAAHPAPKTVTYEEWIRMPEVEDGREEVVNGEIVFMPPARRLHAAVIQNLVLSLGSSLDRKEYEIAASSFGIVIRRQPLQCRNPDIAVFLKKRIVDIDGYYHSAPELAVEILSPTETRKLTESKLRDYEGIGVPEVWIVSPEARTVEVLALRDGRLQTDKIAGGGELRSIALPQAVLEVSSIWPD
jgi:Uma2 family endonuclease